MKIFQKYRTALGLCAAFVKVTNLFVKRRKCRVLCLLCDLPFPDIKFCEHCKQVRSTNSWCESAFFCSTIFTVHPMADCENCGVVVLGLRCWEKMWWGCGGVALLEKKCGVVVMELHCPKKIVVLLQWC